VADVVARLPELAAISPAAAAQVTFDAKYAGYIARQQIGRCPAAAAGHTPHSGRIGLRVRSPSAGRGPRKARRVGPTDLAQAARISGITPADVSVLMIHLEGGKGRAETLNAKR